MAESMPANPDMAVIGAMLGAFAKGELATGHP